MDGPRQLAFAHVQTFIVKAAILVPGLFENVILKHQPPTLLASEPLMKQHFSCLANFVHFDIVSKTFITLDLEQRSRSSKLHSAEFIVFTVTIKKLTLSSVCVTNPLTQKPWVFCD